VLRGVQASEKGVRGDYLPAEKTKAGQPSRHLGWMKTPLASSASAKPIHLGGRGNLAAAQTRNPQEIEKDNELD